MPSTLLQQRLSTRGMYTPRSTLEGPRGYVWAGGDGALPPITLHRHLPGAGGGGRQGRPSVGLTGAAFLARPGAGGGAGKRLPLPTTLCYHRSASSCAPLPLHIQTCTIPPCSASGCWGYTYKKTNKQKTLKTSVIQYPFN